MIFITYLSKLSESYYYGVSKVGQFTKNGVTRNKLIGAGKITQGGGSSSSSESEKRGKG